MIVLMNPERLMGHQRKLRLAIISHTLFRSLNSDIKLARLHKTVFPDVSSEPAFICFFPCYLQHHCSTMLDGSKPRRHRSTVKPGSGGLPPPLENAEGGSCKTKELANQLELWGWCVWPEVAGGRPKMVENSNIVFLSIRFYLRM